MNQQRPPFGKALLEKRQSTNPPWLIVVCVGLYCWRRARQWQKNPQVWALVLPESKSPDQFEWLVDNVCVLIDWHKGLTPEQILVLVKVLIAAGAWQVTVRPGWVDTSQPAYVYDAAKPVDQRWVQVREQIVTYPGNYPT
jgi:hypothetical protein